jgi:hypothetical protein
MQQLVASMQAQTVQQIDEAKVLELLNEYAPTRHLEITSPTSPDLQTVKDAHPQLEQLLKALQAAPVVNVWPYLLGPAGSGKTYVAKQSAKALDLNFYCSTSLQDKYDLLGFVDANGNYNETPFYLAFKYSGVFLLDELDNSSPDAVTAFNMALANGFMTFPNGEQVERHEHCYIVAAGNTFGNGATLRYSSRATLDGATRSRFRVLDVPYDHDLEHSLALSFARAINPDVDPSVIAQATKKMIKARQYIDDQQLESAIITPRQSYAAAAMIAQGETLETAIATILGAELTQAQIRMIK